MEQITKPLGRLRVLLPAGSYQATLRSVALRYNLQKEGEWKEQEFHPSHTILMVWTFEAPDPRNPRRTLTFAVETSADIISYSLGHSLLEALTGRPVVKGESFLPEELVGRKVQVVVDRKGRYQFFPDPDQPPMQEYRELPLVEVRSES
jgi:hypothetical protein